MLDTIISLFNRMFEHIHYLNETKTIKVSCFLYLTLICLINFHVIPNEEHMHIKFYQSEV